MRLSGFTFIKNGTKFDFPFLEAIQCLIRLCDEVIVAVGDSEDDTRDRIQSLNSPKVKIIDTVWDKSLLSGGAVLADETNKALRACTGDWCLYLQGDEVIHEDDDHQIRATLHQAHSRPQIDAIYFRYLHFYGDYFTLNNNPKSYRTEIRLIRNQKNFYSFKDAQGFRKQPESKLHACATDARIFHYGYVKPPRVMKEKMDFSDSLYSGGKQHSTLHLAPDDGLPFVVGLEPFKDSHPEVMRDRIQKSQWHFKPRFQDLSLHQKIKQAKLYPRYFIQKVCGLNLGAYRNYIPTTL